jgi:hypothetical protein
MASFKRDSKENANANFIAKIEEREKRREKELQKEKEARAKAGDPGSRDLTDSELKTLNEIYKKAMNRYRGKASCVGGKSFSERVLLQRLVSAIDELKPSGPQVEIGQTEILTLSEALRDSSNISPEARECCALIASLLKPPISPDWHFIFRVAAKISIFYL